MLDRATTGPSTVQSPKDASRAADTAGEGLDDFAEFLTLAYADWVAACEKQGWVAEFMFTPSGHALVVYDVLSGPVEVTDAGHPLPASPADVDEWLLVSRVGVLRLPADADVRAWVGAIAALLTAGR